MRQGHHYSVYTESPIGRTRVYGLLGIVSVVIVMCLRSVALRYLSRLDEPTPTWVFYVGAATPLLVFGLLVYAFDRLLWRLSLARPLYALVNDVPPPDLSGMYTGTVTWRDAAARERRESQLHATIIQTWQQIVIDFEFLKDDERRHAGSTSEMAFIKQGLDQTKATIQHTYSYESIERADDGGVLRKTIRGTSILDFSRIEKKWTVKGWYYSDDGGSGYIRLEQT